MIKAADDYLIQALALLDSGSSTSFVIGHLTHQLHLLRKQRYIQVGGIGGIMNKDFSFSCTILCTAIEPWQNKLEGGSYHITSGSFENASQPFP